MRGSFPVAATCDDAVGRKSSMTSSDRRCYLLQQGSDLLHAVCKCSAVSPATLARLACTCTILRHVASGEEVWVQVRACARAYAHRHVCMQRIIVHKLSRQCIWLSAALPISLAPFCCATDLLSQGGARR